MSPLFMPICLGHIYVKWKKWWRRYEGFYGEVTSEYFYDDWSPLLSGWRQTRTLLNFITVFMPHFLPGDVKIASRHHQTQIYEKPRSWDPCVSACMGDLFSQNMTQFPVWVGHIFGRLAVILFLKWDIFQIRGHQRPIEASKIASRWFFGHKHMWYVISIFLSCWIYFCHFQWISSNGSRKKWCESS